MQARNARARWASCAIAFGVAAAWWLALVGGRGQEAAPWPVDRVVRLEDEAGVADPLAWEWLDAIRLGASATGAMAGPAALAAERLGKAVDGRYAQALETALAMAQRDDGKLTRAAPGEAGLSDAVASRDMRLAAEGRLARLPDALRREAYRQLDAAAAGAGDDALKTRNLSVLRRVARDHALADVGRQARAMLGDVAFEQGRFAEALAWWRPIVTPRIGLAPEPGPANPARVRVKRILALALEGRPSDAERELDGLRAFAPTARGVLAGEEATYVAHAERWLKSIGDADAGPSAEPWPTLGGGPERGTRIARAPSATLWREGPTWTATLPTPDAPPLAVRLSATRELTLPECPIYPVIGDGLVAWTDGNQVVAHDLATGVVRFRHRAAEKPVEPLTDGHFPTLARGRLFACLSERRAGDAIVAFDLREKLAADARLLWRLSATTPDGEDATFDADPLVLGDGLFASLSRTEGRLTKRWIAAYTLGGALRWRTLVAETHADEPGPSRRTLLVGADGAVVSVTHAGYVAALDPDDGRRLWVVRYPVEPHARSPRSLGAAASADGRLVVAPADAASVFGIDVALGRVLWETPWSKTPTDLGPTPKVSEVVQLLGVAEGRAIFTDRHRLIALDADRGTPIVWQAPSVGRLPGLGRGMLAGSWIFWPTADVASPLRTVSIAEGLPMRTGGSERDPAFYDPTTLRHVPAGNLAWGDGALAVAGPSRLTVFAPAAARVARRQEEARVDRSPATLVRLASAQQLAGLVDDAQATLARAASRIPPSERDAWNALWADWQGGLAPTPNDAPTAKPATPAPRADAVWGPVPGAAPLADRLAGADDCVIVLANDVAACRDAATGAVRWAVPWRDALDWVGHAPHATFLGGPRSLEARAARDGKLLWRAPAPVASAPWLLLGDAPWRPQSPGRFAGFRFVGDRIACFEDRRRVRVLDADTGNYVLAYASSDVAALTGDLLQPFLRTDHATAPGAAVEIAPDDAVWTWSESIRRRVELASGAVRGRDGGDVVCEGPGAEVRWRWKSPWPTSLTGEAPQVFGDGDALLALVPTNLGHELMRLRADTGAVVWARPAHETPDGFDVRDAAVGFGAVAYARDGAVWRRSLEDGRLLGKTPVPSGYGQWRVAPFGDGFVASPRTTCGVPLLPPPGPAPLAVVSLGLGRLERGVAPLVALDPRTGAETRRWRVPHDRGPFSVQILGPHLLVTAGGHVTCLR